MKPIRALAIIVYNTVAKRLPESNSRFSFGAKSCAQGYTPVQPVNIGNDACGWAAM